MDGVGGEVSHKIKAAIKAKLVELGAYVDDELPDYIMVMVANKRSRKQMEDDLSLFLNNNTKVFTAWLHNVLQKLQEVTVAAKDKQDGEKKKAAKKNRSRSPESKDKVKAKKKHKESKKHKEKKSKKGKKDKDKSNALEKAKDLSDWEDDSVVPTLASKPVNQVRDENTKFDVTKEVGRAIIGTLKEKHKTPERIDTITEAEMLQETVVEPPLPITDPETLQVSDSREPSANSDLNPIDVELPASPEPKSIVTSPVSKGIYESQLLSPETSPVEKSVTIMAPTRELLMEHDKLTQEPVRVSPDKRVVSAVSSDSSVSPEELRRQLLLSQAKKKMEERNLERRMRSDSPEIMIVNEMPGKKLGNVAPAAIESVAVEGQAPAALTAMRSESKSPRLSLAATSLESYTRKPSPPSPRRRGNKSRDSDTKRKDKAREKAPRPIEKDRRSRATVSSRVVAPPEPELPGVSSVVHVKPREFGPADKQANKNLILKAVAAAERSVANSSGRKDKSPSPPPPPALAQRPRALYTKDLRNKRYQNFAVTLANDGKDKRNTRDLQNVIEEKRKGEDEHFISCKSTGKDRNETFIHCWLEEVEEAGKQHQLIKPNEIEDPTKDREDVEEVAGSISDDDGNDDDGNDDEAIGDDAHAQIVVTVDGLSSRPDMISRLGKKNVKAVVDANRISNRFAKIGQDDGDHEFKEKFLEFERKRIEKKRNSEGTSKNKQLIAQLSMKFGQIDRVFDDEDKLGARKRLRYLNRAFQDVEKGLSSGKADRPLESRESKRRMDQDVTNADRGVKNRLGSRERIDEDQSRNSKKSDRDRLEERREERFSDYSRERSNIRKDQKSTELFRDRHYNRREDDESFRERQYNRREDKSFNAEREQHKRDDRNREHNLESDRPRNSRSERANNGGDEKKKRRYSHSDRSEDDGKSDRRRRSDETPTPRKRDRSETDDISPIGKKERRSVRVSADTEEVDVKTKERCRFWPECARGTSCDFHHPTSICKLLPHCKFNDSCLYIHPLCKNDGDCSLKNCAYQHSNRSGSKTKQTSRDTMMCKYDSYCRKPDCSYRHTHKSQQSSTKSCIFGSRCNKHDCPYLHSLDA